MKFCICGKFCQQLRSDNAEKADDVHMTYTDGNLKKYGADNTGFMPDQKDDLQ